MRIDLRAPFFPPQPNAAQEAQSAFRPPSFRAIFRPFIQPRTPHRFVRTPEQHNVQANRRWDATGAPRSNYGGNYDATQRADDPYINRANIRSFNKQRAVEQLTRGEHKWRDLNQNNNTEISYSFLGHGFDEYEKQEARRSIQSWGDVANLAFTENGGQAEGRLTFRLSEERGARGAYPGPYHDSGNTTYNRSFLARHVMTHEIGHTLGLTHPGHYDAKYKWSHSDRVYAQDSKAHTVMSYFPAEDSGKSMSVIPNAPMMDDISAIQHNYGANYQTRRENNTYGFNSNTGRDYYSLRSNRDAAAFCIWDGAGNDTLDVSGYGTNQVINLRAGSFSDVGHGRGNVSIARGVTMENAIGGSGHDALIGNDENNRLTGGGGADRLRGGRGADSFVYNHASDSTLQDPDEIMDFTSGTDKIDVRGALRNAGLSSLSVVQAWSGKAGEALLTYDERSGMGSVAIDLNGNGRADLFIKTHGQVRPSDLVPHSAAKVTKRYLPLLATPPVMPRVGTSVAKPRFIFNSAHDSSFSNPRLLTDFTSGTDSIDLRGVEKEANTRLKLVEAFTGRVGDTRVQYNAQSGRYFIAIDLTGNRKTDFLVKSTQVIKPKDIIVT